MKKNDFFAKMAKTAFAFAVVLIMSMAFTACSGSDDNDNDNGGAPPLTLVIDGVKTEVKSAEIVNHRDNNFILFLHLSENHGKVEIHGNTQRHNGKTIDLTKQEENTDSWSWLITWIDKENAPKFSSFGKFETLLFKTGTMKLNVNLETGEYEVVIANGKIHNKKDDGNDGNEHTIEMNWKGKAGFLL